MKSYGDFITSAPEELNVSFAFLVVPPGEPFPEHLRNTNMCAAVVCYVGPMNKAQEVVRPLKEFGPPAFDGTGPVPYPMLQGAFDAIAPSGLHNYWKADFVTDLSDDIISAHLKFGPCVPNIFSMAFIYSISGAARKAGKNETAWSYRDANYSHIIAAADSDAAAMPKHTEWVRDYCSALHPHSAGGAYVNFLMDEGDERIAASYRDNYQRLAKIKRKYDPGNLFRMNQNIKPSGAA